MNATSRDVVLLGVGHTHAHVVRMWQQHAPPHARLTCVSDYPIATYSGMLPGVLAGQYAPDDMQIDLHRLCAAAGAQLIVGTVTGLDLERREVRLEGQPPLPFDVLSIGLGSVPTTAGVCVTDTGPVVPTKPMQTFLSRLDARLIDVAARRPGRSLKILIVGGGAGGVETALCLPPHVRARLGAHVPLLRTIVTAETEVLGGSLPATQRRVERVLAAQGVGVHRSTRVAAVDASNVTMADGAVVPADVVVWATGAAAPPLLAALGLPTDGAGFLLTHETLQSVSGRPIFAVGDTGQIAGKRVPRAGVHAVRQGPVLWSNIQRTLTGQPLVSYVPQPSFLRLINTGNGRAVGEWKGLSFEGAWVRRWKDRMDRRFVDQYRP